MSVAGIGSVTTHVCEEGKKKYIVTNPKAVVCSNCRVRKISNFTTVRNKSPVYFSV